MGETLKNLYHRLGAVEIVSTGLVKTTDDHEVRLRKLEHLTAKVVGGAIVGSALGGWLLSKLGVLIG